MELLENKVAPIVAEDKPLTGVYELYCAWKALPPFFKRPPIPRGAKEAPAVEDYLERSAIDDPLIIELSKLPTQKAFAEKYGVSEDTLSDWNKTQGVKDSLSEIRGWSRQLSKNVLFSLYNRAMKDGSAFEVKLWFQLVEKWEEKARIEHDYKGVTEIQIIKKVVEDKFNIKNESTEQRNEDKMGTDGQAS